MNALAVSTDYGAQRGQESAATVGIGERCVSACDLRDIRVWPQPDGRPATRPRGYRLAAPPSPPPPADPAARPGPAVAAMNRFAPGSAAARRTGLPSEPSPPLET